ncbi:MAG: tRNA pseudouridine32 synthase / rRNA pseudouridine746 synthase [Alphaproteobacteria bacterium]|jgi:tRNA pseudouridine32 synthase/23S rRNA pseudouridine746 synthase|nr:tRNA pseudouridine32 synthase / rRNA pseudouridine746 synthase [Alphaproteobacteria bacterium]
MNAKITPEEMVARLIYRDGLMLVIDKPSGYAVHRGPKGGESLEDHFGALRFGLPRAPALAHRLDRDTSGCLVLGRHRKALAELGRLFKAGRIGKTYWAVVEGGPSAEEGRIEMPLGRRDETRGWWMKPDPHGQPAVTLWRVLGRSFVAATADPVLGAVAPQRCLPPSPVEDGRNRPDAGEGTGPEVAANSAPASTPLPNPPPQRGREQSGASGGGSGSPPTRSNPAGQVTWLALEPLTGRTHQLRVHCAEMGWPIVGDTIYGSAPRAGGPPLHLHAREIVVPLYKKRDPIRAMAPVPLHMHDRLQACGWQGEVFRLVD